jgi:hypothetical protein
MSRLLFAAARGARIEANSCLLHYRPTYQNWWRVTQKWSAMHESVIRIHPEDAHLAYGPISTDIRNMRSIDLHDEQMPILALGSACVCGLDGTWAKDWQTQTVNERATAMLILAEALADEGM